MADISFVKMDIAKLAMRYAGLGGDRCPNEELADWFRGLVHALVDRAPEAHEFAADLLGEAEGYRRAEAERKRRAKEDREAAETAKRGRIHASADSKESKENPERAHRSDQSKANNRERETLSLESKESPESAEQHPPGEQQAGTPSGSPSSNGARPKTETGKTPKAEKEEKNIIPPSLEMVTRYCEKRNNGIDPVRFLAYYAARDWKMKGTKITNWHACAITWEKTNGDFKASGARRGDSAPVGPLV